MKWLVYKSSHWRFHEEKSVGTSSEFVCRSRVLINFNSTVAITNTNILLIQLNVAISPFGKHQGRLGIKIDGFSKKNQPVCLFMPILLIPWLVLKSVSLFSVIFYSLILLGNHAPDCKQRWRHFLVIGLFVGTGAYYIMFTRLYKYKWCDPHVDHFLLYSGWLIHLPFLIKQLFILTFVGLPFHSHYQRILL